MDAFFVVLERYVDDVAEAPLGTGGQVVVSHSAHVLDMEEVEDVMNAEYQLVVGTMGVHDMTALGEIHQTGVAGIPAGLAELDELPIRFTEVIDGNADAIRSAVCVFLDEQAR